MRILSLKTAAKKHQSQLLDESFVSSLEKEGVKIVVRKGRNHFYATKVFESGALKEALPKFDQSNINSRGTTELGDTFYRYVKFDFIFLRRRGEYICIKEAKFICRSLHKRLFRFCSYHFYY